MVNFDGNPHDALIALCAAMFAIVVWATAAWWFGIPTSESHALIAGLSGAAIALNNGLAGINGHEWVKVLYGLVLSTCFGFGLGWLTSKTTELVCRRKDRRKTEGFFKNAQIASGAAMASCTAHKTVKNSSAFFCSGFFLPTDKAAKVVFAVPFWLIIFVRLL
jgi:PiT family inorganic phosphate transporter